MYQIALGIYLYFENCINTNITVDGKWIIELYSVQTFLLERV